MYTIDFGLGKLVNILCTFTRLIQSTVYTALFIVILFSNLPRKKMYSWFFESPWKTDRELGFPRKGKPQKNRVIFI